MNDSNYYSLFLKFIETYGPMGYKGVQKDDPLVLKLDTIMDKNNQFFYIGDMIEWEMVYSSKGSLDIFGIEPENLNPGNIFTRTHPEDLQRHSVSRSKVVKMCNDLYITKDDHKILSTNLRFLNAKGTYSNILVQGYAFNCNVLKPTVCCLFIQTDISWFGPIKHGYNNYIGEDMSCFRLPDRDIILTGCIFTNREFEILNLIRKGLDSKTIGEKLFLSSHTIDTHRRNILKKTGSKSTSDLIMELTEKGFF